MNLRIETGWFYADDLNPRQGTEPGKVRPGLVVQSDLLKRRLDGFAARHISVRL